MTQGDRSGLILACCGSAAAAAAVTALLVSRSRNSRSLFERELERVRRECRHLREANERLQKTLPERNGSFDETSKSTLTIAEIETLKAVFDCFDATGSGALTIQDISLVHSKLGEPLTDEEAAQAMAILDPARTGMVTFRQFREWWENKHKDFDNADNYRQRFKLLRAKLEDSSGFDITKIQTQQVGQPGSRRFRVKFYYKQKNNVLKQISPWHDIPLFNLGTGQHAKIFNFICEIPKWTRAKYEIATGELFNPIKQDVKNGQLRFYKWGDMMFNYGAFPQTWEDPKLVHPDTQKSGDNDPIDVIEIGTKQMQTGEVAPVKVLGILALIDDNETDWKVLAIQINDPLAGELNDIDDVQQKVPGAVHAIREYLRVYKTLEGKPENSFALDEEFMPKDYAVSIIEETHNSWLALRSGNKDTV
ncbi:inorganic diphosphatase [Plasmodiophora brassicae]|uniref:inorganic diphosphatase n=1 Tax=Plasmodiophora brassicae TaxID=37360 RepID=A0A0G4ISA5_PLABS|nr:hypothetical protein PBRA_006214 [Plasmodiophora brassicae]SPQ96081.1 unnamed protein product [Plasmodiophora brassicae]